MAAAALALALLHFWSAASSGSPDYIYHDEEITIAVSEEMRSSGTLNTDWSQSESLAAIWPEGQYNFSASILAYQPPAMVACAAMRGCARATNFHALRVGPAFFSGLGLFFFILFFARLAGPFVALMAGGLMVFSAQLFVDAIYIRPEGFVLFCAGLGFYVASRAADASRRWRIGLWIGVGVLGGLACATKFSLIYLALHLLVTGLALRFGADLPWRDGRAAVAHVWRHAREIAAAAGLWLLGLFVGFAAGAPYAIGDPGGYLAGVRALLHQYSDIHPPYGSGAANALGHIAFGAHWLIDSLGLLQLVMSAAGFLLLLRRNVLLAIALSAPTALFLIYFISKPVFFERNFSLYLPLIAFGAAYCAGRISAAATGWARPAAASFLGLALLLGPVMLWTRVFTDIMPLQHQRVDELRIHARTVAARLGAAVEEPQMVLPATVDDLARRAQPAAVHPVFAFRDPFTGEAIRRLQDDYGWTLLAADPGPLPDVARSTLTVFHAPGHVLLLSPGDLAPRDFLRLADLCPAGAAPDIVAEGFALDGYFPAVQPPGGLGPWWGSYIAEEPGADGDAAMGVLTIGPFLPPEGAALPLVTGPGGDNLSIVMTDAAGAELARFTGLVTEQPVALRLPDAAGPVIIRVEDAGAGYGQWIAVAAPAAAGAACNP